MASDHTNILFLSNENKSFLLLIYQFVANDFFENVESNFDTYILHTIYLKKEVYITTGNFLNR